MGSNINFKNFGTDPPAEAGGGGRLPGNFPLTRQASIYSLTFDEFQSTVGGSGKDFGSMNMDELLKSIWSAEENQNIGSTSGGGGGGGGGGGQEGSGYLQKQGSLTLPRTLSQKTVDEVWRDMSKEYGGGKDATGSISGFGVPQRQPTLGEITLEEFLVRAGVVKEEAQLAAKAKNVGFFGDLSLPVNGSMLEFGYQQQQQARGTAGLMGGRIAESSNQVAMQSATLPLNVNGARSATQQLGSQQQLAQPQQQQLLPKQPTLAYGIPRNSQLGSPGIRSGIIGISDPGINDSMVQNVTLQGGGVGMVGLGANGVTVTTGSPAVSSDGLTKSNGDTSSVSPVPYVFNGCLRGRKSAALEKVVERRQRRMIKNRESAARSRARKQAYTMELEAEVAKLKEENEELRKKQDEIMEMQKNQVQEMMNQQNGNKRRCLRRTQTGPW
ncbi:ABSCISIC ACID-INSENSITIVE 5-like protein 5 [Sesamum alatum]|uniref:ABSCISIC ACID-INSENSITIVE 5-like protein 5 n=1 Tax=Sesamum alatum TaxID=300844 RepID=A0AAE1YQB5_9LAMI|nr:ABSCISIC ACID-INSENSITIVE 5-like protein 5 [Sesamum alatum]